MRNVADRIGCSLESVPTPGLIVDHEVLIRKVFIRFALLLILTVSSLEAREIHVRGDADPGPKDGSVEFLEWLLNEKLPGPSPELVRKAIGVLKETRYLDE